MTYAEFHKRNDASYDMQVALVERATSKILWTETYHQDFSDEVHYIQYAGLGDLYSGSWRYQHKAHASDRRSNDSGRLNRLRKGNKRVKSTSSMRKDAVGVLAKRAADYVLAQKLIRE